MKLISRRDYLSELMQLASTPDIKVITGVRRSGKSRLLEEFRTAISAKEKASVIHIDFNLTEHEHLLEYHALEKYIESRYVPGLNNYVLIDEIELCPSFEKAINSLHAKGRYDIYVTGSNAFLQSSDLATLFVGRTYELHIFPFSFKEYMEYYAYTDIYAAFARYMAEGGMAGAYLYSSEKQKYRYINSEVLNALIVRDIVNKYKIRNEQLMQRIIDFLMDNIGSIVSLRKIKNTLSSGGFSADHKTIGKYIDYLCKAFAFYKVRKYDIKGKRYLAAEDKYYLSDHVFRYARLGTKNMDYGHILENIIAIELMRRGYEVYAGSLYRKEIDFVAIRQGEKIYIQAAYDISSKETFEREAAPLLSVRDAYPKIIIARTCQPEWQHEGIRVIDAADWLMSGPQA